MSFDIINFCADHHITLYSEGYKNVPAGCVGFQCPFCGDHSNHMHMRLGTNWLKCWRCGKHSLLSLVMALCNVFPIEARDIIARYDKTSPRGLQAQEQRIFAKAIVYPAGMGALTENHRIYLSSRDFDPVGIADTWKIQGTNHIDPNYKWRIIAPITFRGQTVSYQARDVTCIQEPKYKACPPEHEVISHKDILYGYDEARGDAVVIVEGITDVWRLGAGAVATFGTQWTKAQALLAIQKWDKIFILFDPDDPGQLAGLSLYHFLRGFKESVELLQLNGYSDPGSMPQSEADYLMKKGLGL
jgi:DNA primase